MRIVSKAVIRKDTFIYPKSDKVIVSRMIDMIDEINTEENVANMSIEQYNECSAVSSACVRNTMIKEHGVRKGYFDRGLDISTGRGRLPLLKNTGVSVTMNAIEGPLAKIAEEIGGATWDEYQKFLYVNNCSSKIRYSTDNMRGWTELCGVCYEDYKMHYSNEKVTVPWDEYVEEFMSIYGLYPEDYGNWDEFYCIYAHVFEDVAEEYFRRVLSTLEC